MPHATDTVREYTPPVEGTIARITAEIDEQLDILTTTTGKGAVAKRQAASTKIVELRQQLADIGLEASRRAARAEQKAEELLDAYTARVDELTRSEQQTTNANVAGELRAQLVLFTGVELNFAPTRTGESSFAYRLASPDERVNVLIDIASHRIRVSNDATDFGYVFVSYDSWSGRLDGTAFHTLSNVLDVKPTKGNTPKRVHGSMFKQPSRSRTSRQTRPYSSGLMVDVLRRSGFTVPDDIASGGFGTLSSLILSGGFDLSKVDAMSSSSMREFIRQSLVGKGFSDDVIEYALQYV